MIISRTPFRISFVGGGTDLKSFYQQHAGAVVSTSIDKYIYLSAHEYFHKDKSLIKYRHTEEVDDVRLIKHPIIREVFTRMGVNNIDFNSIADIPAGTGMGSSSAFTAGIIKLALAITKQTMSNEAIAQKACEIEIDILNEPIGKQDQYACALGGMNLLVFKPDDTVQIEPLIMPVEQEAKLEKKLHLFYTGTTRSASEILAEQRDNTIADVQKFNMLKEMSGMAYQLYDELTKGNLDALGYFLNEGWMRKKELAGKISNTTIDALYETGIKAGATGGKLLGAGGGGFLLFYCEDDKLEALKKSLHNLVYFPFKFDKSGTVIIFKD